MDSNDHDDDQFSDTYDEEADSDFDEDGVDSAVDDASSSEDNNGAKAQTKKVVKQDDASRRDPKAEDLGELDSGDEATIRQQRKTRRKQKRKGEEADDDSHEDEAGWRAKTRSMREKEKDDKTRNKLATLEGSNVDVEKLWEEMNRPGPLPPVRIEASSHEEEDKTLSHENNKHDRMAIDSVQDKENIPVTNDNEMIMIKRTYKFAGEIHVEEKTVARSSAEARLWLTQQSSTPHAVTESGTSLQKPLRKTSRFDPNHSNLAAFKGSWTSTTADIKLKTAKLNVVEKSKMDWAVHVDAEGLKDELDEHAKAKEGYLSRMDFLSEVEQRKEAEARAARLKKT